MRDDPLAMPVAPQKRVRGIAVLTDSPKIRFGFESLKDLHKEIPGMINPGSN